MKKRKGLGVEILADSKNYALMLTWLGVSTGVQNCNSVLEACYQQQTQISVMDGGRHIFNYVQLRDTFSSPDKNTPWRTEKKNSL